MHESPLEAELDPTELADALAQCQQELQQVVYAISHDLQAPLRAVRSVSEILAANADNLSAPQAKRQLRLIADSAARMQGQIDDLMTYSRIGTRGQTPQPTELDAILVEAQRGQQSTIAAAAATLRIGPLPRVWGDPPQLITLFKALLSNALKFRRGAPLIEVTAREEDAFACITVRDNGIGIAPGELLSVFDLFRRLHNEDTYPGNGTGLALARRIVARHGGRIWIESSLGEHTAVHVTLRRVLSD